MEGKAHLATSDIPGLIGQKIRIHATAWKGIAALLSSVSIEAVAERTRASHPPRESFLPPATPSRVVIHDEGVVPPAEVLSSVQNRRLSRKSLGLAPHANGPPNAGPVSHKASSTRVSMSSSIFQARSEHTNGDMSFVTNVEDDDEDDELDEIEDDIAVPSGKKSARLRVYSDDEGDEQDNAENQGEPSEVHGRYDDLAHEPPASSPTAGPKPEDDLAQEPPVSFRTAAFKPDSEQEVSLVDAKHETTSVKGSQPEPQRDPSPLVFKSLPKLENRSSGSRDGSGAFSCSPFY